MATYQITYQGKTKSLSGWAAEIGITKAAMSMRVTEFAATDREEFLNNITTVQKKRLLRPKEGNREVKLYAGKTPAEWALEKGVSRQAIHQRLAHVGTRYSSVEEAMNFEPK